MPRINPQAGMLPPKIARSMINLVPYKEFKGKLLADPFCGSGRVLVEAAEMGYEVMGTDISNDQVRDTQENLKFVGVEPKVKLHDATHLSEVITGVDAIVTEPFLGKPNLRPDQIRFVAPGLEKLYLGSLKDWLKVLKPGGYVVMVFPIFKGPKNEYKTSRVIDDKHLLGYNQLTRGLVYSRPEADTKREIVVLQKQ
jgi:tRNA G10  N-methylase Trm11